MRLRQPARRQTLNTANRELARLGKHQRRIARVPANGFLKPRCVQRLEHRVWSIGGLGLDPARRQSNQQRDRGSDKLQRPVFRMPREAQWDRVTKLVQGLNANVVVKAERGMSPVSSW